MLLLPLFLLMQLEPSAVTCCAASGSCFDAATESECMEALTAEGDDSADQVISDGLDDQCSSPIDVPEDLIRDYLVAVDGCDATSCIVREVLSCEPLILGDQFATVYISHRDDLEAGFTFEVRVDDARLVITAEEMSCSL